jgi:hypothetical protein
LSELLTLAATIPMMHSKNQDIEGSETIR